MWDEYGMWLDRWGFVSWSCTLCEGGVRSSTPLLKAGSRQATLSLGEEVGGEGQGSSSWHKSSTFCPQGQRCWHLTQSNLHCRGVAGWGLETAVRGGTIRGTDHDALIWKNKDKLRLSPTDDRWWEMFFSLWFSSYLHGGLHWWNGVDTSARVCLREVVLGGSKGPRDCEASSSSRSLGRTSSLMLVSSRLLGEMERFQSNLFRLASTGNTTRFKGGG